jgi:long-chain fatty acid transport protein
MRRLALLACAAATLASTPAHAAGFLIYDLSGEALGKASAVTASTEGPDAVFFNPASLAFQPGYAATVGGVMVASRARFEPLGGGDEVKSKPGLFFLPTIYASGRVHERVAVGLGVFPAFGLSLTWPDNWAGRESAIKASIETATINPVVSVSLIPETLSLAAGVQIVRGAVEFVNGLPPLVGGEARLGGGTWGVGANMGLLYRPLPERLHLAFTYRSRVKLPFKGRVDFDPNPEFANQLPDQGGSASILLPDVLSLGVMWRPVPSVTLTFDPNLVLWSTYDKLVIDFQSAPDLVMERRSKNVFTLRLGADWATPAPGLSLRAGFIFDQNPAPSSTLSPSLPDSNRVDFTVGVGYAFGTARAFRADLGYMLVYFLPAEARGGTEGPEGTYHTVAHLLGLGVTGRFGAH